MSFNFATPCIRRARLMNTSIKTLLVVVLTASVLVISAAFTSRPFVRAAHAHHFAVNKAVPFLPLTYNAPPARTDRNRLRLHLNGDSLELLDSNQGTVLTTRSFDSTSSVIINGSPSDDTLVVDFTNGNPVPVGGITFNGGDQVTRKGDIVEIEGGSFQNAVYDYYNAHDGRISLDGSIINYTGLEPLTNTGTAANVIFNLPAGTVGASLQDDGTPGNNTVQLAS